MTDAKRLAAKVLQEHGTTYACEAGITLRDKPSPLFQLLVLCMLFAAPIRPSAAVASARELFASGWRTPQRLLDSTWQERVDALGRGGYRRYDESTARYLEDATRRVDEQYGGDLRRLRVRAHGDPRRVHQLLQEFPRIGPTGADIFCREVQAVWPSLRPFFDDRATEGARRAGLPDDRQRLAALIGPPQFAAFAAALVRLEQS